MSLHKVKAGNDIKGVEMYEMKDILDLEKDAMAVVKSRYLLCILVSQRIHQLEKGAQVCLDIDQSDVSPKSYYSLALREIIEGNMDLEQLKS